MPLMSRLNKVVVAVDFVAGVSKTAATTPIIMLLGVGIAWLGLLQAIAFLILTMDQMKTLRWL